MFTVIQDDDYIYVKIKAPYANINEVEIHYGENTFLFYSKPYHLKINLPSKILPNDDTYHILKYDSDDGIFTVGAPKKNKGEFFENLAMITELLMPSRSVESPYIGVDESDTSSSDEEPEEDVTTSGTENVIGSNESVCKQYGYGFGWHHHGVLHLLQEELLSFVDLDNMETLKIDSRNDACLELDRLSFQPEHYIADLLEKNEELLQCLKFELPSSAYELSDDNIFHLKELKRHKRPKLTKKCHHDVALGLIDIIFAYLYDLRTTSGEHTVESGWTIKKLSPTLSCFVRWVDAKEAVEGAVRRSVCYPLYRNWDLSLLVLSDLKSMIKAGRVAVLHCLTDIYKVFMNSGDFRYLLNDLYMTEYCLWIQRVKTEILDWLNDQIKDIQISKDDIGIDLLELEAEAHLISLRFSDNKTDKTQNESDTDSDDEKIGECEVEEVDSDDAAETTSELE